MLMLNKDDFTWKEGLTVRELLEDLKARGKYQATKGSPGTMVVINGNIVTRDQYSSKTVGKNDMIHLMSFVTGG
jgi:thiamine biosynthesis protein ThiS